MRWHRVLVAIVFGAACTSGPLPTLGDSYYPTLGNGGYDVLHYDLSLVIDPLQGRLSGTATLQVRPERDLRDFALDLVGLDVRTVTVDGAAASFSRADGKLRVQPTTTARAGSTASVVIAYDGLPATRTTPSSDGGWHASGQEVYVTSEPDGASSWYPVNDHPLDKATYTFRLTVPTPYVAVANGTLTSSSTAGSMSTFVWSEPWPMASYLATVAVGRYAEVPMSSGTTQIRIYARPELATRTASIFAEQTTMLEYFAGLVGPYPFDSYGEIITRDSRWTLETQTRSVFSEAILTEDPNAARELVAHELAHQWFGDSVSLSTWRDIWLNEGFATYLSWLYLEHVGQRDYLESRMRDQYGAVVNAPLSVELIDHPDLPPTRVAEILRVLYQPNGHPATDTEILHAMGASSLDQLTAGRALGLLGTRPSSDDARVLREMARSSAPTKPPALDLFAPSVYARGAMALQALRVDVGDATFFRILRTYTDRYRYANATTANFESVAAEVSGADLSTLFRIWLEDDAAPPMPRFLPSQ